MHNQDACIFLNGEITPGNSGLELLPGTYLIAVDGGVRHLRVRNHLPDILIGDLDSAMPEDIAWCKAGGVKVEQHPREKDSTDCELALAHALQVVSGRVLLFGALGGRMDHSLANISLLASPACAGRDVRIVNGVESLFMIRDHRVITGSAGDVLSLLPWGSDCEGVATSGLQYPLRDERLLLAGSRGISNVMLSNQVEIYCRKGNLLCVHYRSL